MAETPTISINVQSGDWRPDSQDASQLSYRPYCAANAVEEKLD